MIKEDCPHLCEVISSGEKVKACRQDEYTVNTYFSCENCKRGKKDSELQGTSSLDDIKKDKCPFFFEISDVKRDRDGHKELEVHRRCNVPIDRMLDDGMGESCDFYDNYRKCPVYQKESSKKK